MRATNSRQDVFALALRISAAQDICVATAQPFGKGEKAFKAFYGLFAFIYSFVSFTITLSSLASLKYSVFILFSFISIRKVMAADEFCDILNFWNPTWDKLTEQLLHYSTFVCMFDTEVIHWHLNLVKKCSF